MTVSGDVEGAVGGELHQVQRGEVAGGVVEEHVLAARIRGVDARRVFAGVPAVDGGVVLHAGVAALPGGFADLLQEIAGLVGLYRVAGLDGLGGKVGIAHDGVHEVVGDADAVVGVLEKDRAVGFGIGGGAVVALLHEGPGLGFFLGLAVDELNDVGVVDVEDDHLGGATCLATGLDDAGEGVETAHERKRTAGSAAAGELLVGGAQRRQVGAGAASPLEEHAFGLGEGQDGVERIVHRVDEAGGALRARVSDGPELGLALQEIPVPVAAIGVGLNAIAADVEPHGRVEGHLLLDEQVHEFVVENGGVFVGAEVSTLEAPAGDGFGNAADQGADAGLALLGADGAVQIFAGDDVGGGHRPVFGDLDILLLEDDVALGVGDGGGTQLPLDFVVGREASLGEEALEGEARAFFSGWLAGGGTDVSFRAHRCFLSCLGH